MGLYANKYKYGVSQNGITRIISAGLLLGAACLSVVGCGSGGYAGQALASLSASSVTIDAGQTFSVSANDPGNLPLTWTLSSAACTGAGCGTVSSVTGLTTTYTAPSPLTSPLGVTLQAAISGTQSSKTVAITVNPAPAITGATPNGTVGVPYSATLTASGGTGALTLSLASGTLPAGLSFNPKTGVISGTPTANGTSSFTVQVVDQSSVPDTVTVSRQITIGSTAGTLTLGGNPPAGVVGTPYTTALTATGGTAPYTFTLASGSLPAGLTLSSAGIISGTPTASGTSTFTAQLQDASGTKTTAGFAISITATSGGIVLTTGTLPSGTVGTPYSSTIGVAGGTGPYSCAIAGGGLPAGLSLGSGCVVSGTPTMAGTSSVTVRATDNGGNTVTGTVGITINATSPTLTTGTLPAGTAGTPYSGTIGVTGGTAPYTCTINAGTLPAGLTLGAGCVVSGTPTTTGTSTVTVGVTDSGTPPGATTGPVSITINPAALSINSGTLPNGVVGTPYSSTVAVTGGTGPYSCSVVSGSLPTGLAFGANCIVTGTPTVAGTSTPTVKATDSSNPQLSTTKPISITITSAAATIVIASPPAATVNTPYTGTIPVTGGTGPYACALSGGALPAGLTLNSSCQITGTPTTSGSTTVTVKATDSSSPTNSNTGPVTVTVNPGSATLTFGTPPAATVNAPYTGTIPVAGGTAPYACALAGGSLPSGLALNANCTITGTPTSAGSSTITVKGTDSANPANSNNGSVVVTVNPAPVTLTIGAPPAGTVNTAYTGTIPVAGGTAPYTCALTGGTLQAGLTLGTNCVITGTPTVSGTNTITVKATDSASPANTNTASVPVTINPAAVTLTLGTPPAATVNTPYTGTIPVSGGTAPYTCALTGGTLQAGLTLGTNCVITGTPTVSGTNTITVKATDSANPANTNTGNVAVTVNPAAVTLTIGTPPAATINKPYSGTIPVSGGTAPYTCALTGGTLQAGLALNANCTITGTPTVSGTNTITVKATDSANPANTNSASIPVTVNTTGATLSLGVPPAATINMPYSGTIPVAGGTGPYACALTGGSLQAGLTLNANCVITGTPTVAGTNTIMVKATDSASPANTTTASVPVTVNPAAVTLTIGAPPAGTVNTAYTGTIPVAGGTAPYTCALTAGTLQAGLTLGTNCVITGTPTVSGTNTITVKATDSASPANTNTASVPVTINPAAVTLTLGTPPAATVNTPYTGTIPVAGGTAPYTCALTGGTLQAGLTLGTNCVITGTPTVSGTNTITVKATDSASPANTNSGSVAVTVKPAAVTLALGTPPAGTVNKPYSGTIPVSGGTAPYTCALTGGTLQAGLTLGTNCVITGTPTASGTNTITVKATDSANPANTTTGTVPVTINPAAATLSIGNPPVATVTVPYTGTIPVTGGTGPYTCTVASGTLPTGITLGAGCVLSGTPTTVAVTTVGITATDSSNPVNTTTSPVAITVQAIPALTFTGSLPNGVVNVPYSQTLQATGGVGPYTYAVTAGTLPAGLTLSTAGVVSGTPTTPGASSFTVTATDSEGKPQTASLPLVLLITYPATPSDALLKGPYAFLFQGYDDAVAGVAAYQTATIGSFNADGAGVLNTGELDSNHQTSAPTGNTVPTRSFLGTYTIGTDGRGYFAVTTLNADGTVAATTTYRIALRLPVAPATLATTGSLIEYDGDRLYGTKGSGTLLAQNPTAIANGLTGSYAFGIAGDTPCLPTCTLSVLTAGPVVEVGQFNAAGGTITGGEADTNAAATHFGNSVLSGTYAAPDGNGRVQLAMTTSDLTGTVYPTDFAVYIVDANNAFLMSTDKHSAYVLQAGTAKLQTQATYSNASLNAPFVGYENAQVNPGLVSGTVLNQVLNFSSATIFEGLGNGDGTCTTRSVTNAGLTGALSTLPGSVVGGTSLVPGIVGSYTATGTAGCTVQTNGRATIDYVTPTSLVGGLLPVLGSSTPAPRVAYLVSPNAGYFLETSYAGLGTLEAQTGAPFSLATLNGTFVYNTVPASTLATIDASGVFTADGAGHTASTLDENTGVGTFNVLQLGVAGSATYTLTAQPAPYDPAQVGEYTLSDGTTIYAINPGRFVLLNPGPVSTSPYIVLLF